MYASQTKRLCVRGAPGSDETRVQHSTQPDATTATSATSTPATTDSTATSSSVATSTSKPTSSSKSNYSMTNRLPENHQSPVKNPRDSHLHLNVTIRPDSGAIMTASAATNDPSATADNTIRLPSKDGSSSNQLKNDSIDSFNCNNNVDSNQQDSNKSRTTQDYTPAGDSDVDSFDQLIDPLKTPHSVKHSIDVIIKIRNLVTACNKRKDLLVNSQNFSDIIKLIDKSSVHHSNDVGIQTQVALLLCSIAKSSEENVKLLNKLLVDQMLMTLILESQDETVIEASLRCLRSVMSWPRVSQSWLIYDDIVDSNHSNPTIISINQSQSRQNDLKNIIDYALTTNSLTSKICVADIFAATCIRPKDQLLLFNSNAIRCITAFIESASSQLVVSTLNWLSRMCVKNQMISSQIVKTRCPSGILVLDRLSDLMGKQETIDLQFLSARCYAYIYRSLETDCLMHDQRITSHVLPTLIRMVHNDKPTHLRVKSAECIAYLIEVETRLQSVASVCDHLIDSLADMLETDHHPSRTISKSYPRLVSTFAQGHDKGCTWWAFRSREVDLMPSYAPLNLKDESKTINDADLENERYDSIDLEMKRAAFLALASLSSNLEPIRKKILSSYPMIQHLTRNLDPNDIKTLKSVLTCLLSLSRSVQSLRTSFTETTVYNSLKSLLDTAKNSPRRKFPHDVLLLLLGIVCNICLDFSPGKHIFLDSKTIDNICNLTRKNDRMLRLHGVWILMNMVYHQDDLNIKFQILRSMGLSQLLNLLDIKDDDELVLKTLGFLRNLFSQNKQHIDSIMMNHGDSIMQALMKILNRQASSRIKGQALCVLSNIADGIDSKSFIMEKKDLLDQLVMVISDESSGDMREAACTCITNLAHPKSEGSHERREELRRHGIEEKLKPLLNADDADLADKARTAFNQFIIAADDSYVNKSRSVTSWLDQQTKPHVS